MKKRAGNFAAVLAIVISACSAKPAAPQINSADIQATSVSAAFTIVAETLSAIPTQTNIPPTLTEMPTLTPTETPQPTPTIDPLLITPTVTPTLPASPTTTPVDFSACNKILTDWEGPSASLSTIYEYSPQSNKDKVVLSIWVVADTGECGYLTDLSTGPIGQYSVTAYIDGEKSFKVHGFFRINGGSWKIIIRNETIRSQGSCYPNC